ncbi:MAG: hypothetical protein ACI4WM_00125, partial [Erysipelotrichaceae bacterium]
KLSFSCDGYLKDNNKFNLNALMTIKENDGYKVPDNVENTISSGEYKNQRSIDEDLMKLLNAWRDLYKNDSISGKTAVNVNCGIIELNDESDFYIWKKGSKLISSLQKNGIHLFYGNNRVCDENGNVLSLDDNGDFDTSKLLNIIYEICLDAKMDCLKLDSRDVYTVYLNEEGMNRVVSTIVPQIKSSPASFRSGSLKIYIENEKLKSIEISCSGNVDVLVSSASASVNVSLSIDDNTRYMPLPEAVINTLIG